jgi:hypothetical protein
MKLLVSSNETVSFKAWNKNGKGRIGFV